MENKKRQSIVGTVNPLVMATDGMSGGCGDLMPPAIHGGVIGEGSLEYEFNKELSDKEIEDMLDSSQIENERFKIDQFKKYFGFDVKWFALNDTSTGDALAIACITENNPC